MQIETNEASKKIDPYCCNIKALISGKLETVGHVLREVSRDVFFFIGEEGGRVDGFMLPTRYRPSSILSGGLEIPLILTFRSLRYNTHHNMKDFMTKLYCYDHEPDNVESESDDETHIDIKDNTVVVESDSEVAAPKTKKRKIPIVHSSDDSKGEKSDIEEGKKTKTKFMVSDSEVSQTVNPNTNRFATKTRKATESLDIDIGMNMNVENNITSE